MATDHEPRDAELIAALQRTAEPPLGLTARLEVSVVRRARESTGLTAAEKVVAVSFGLGAVLLGGGVGAPWLVLLAALGTWGYAQWTMLVDEEA